MNERESETIAGLLEQMGYTNAAGYEDADVIVVNTCSVRENADNRFFGLLGWIKHIKMSRPDVIIAVCGCMMQQDHIVAQIRDKHAWVDIVFGTHNIDVLPDLIGDVLSRREREIGEKKEREKREERETYGPAYKPRASKPAVSILSKRVLLVEGLPARRGFSFKASVNIMYGCDNFCTYCIVPYTRGREISRDANSILEEVRGLTASGTKEILLLGQNVNSYTGKSGEIGKTAEISETDKTYTAGKTCINDNACNVGKTCINGNACNVGKTCNIGKAGETGKTVETGKTGEDGGVAGNSEANTVKYVDFADLIGLVDEAPGVERIRFMTSHPKDLSGKLIEKFRPAEKGGAGHLCPSIHLPVQAGSTRILKRMNRCYTKEEYIALIDSLRMARPDIVITTDFIVGFPGETDEDFGDTMDIIERVRFDAAFTFLFSPRKGTPAEEYDDPVPAAVMRERFDRMVRRLNEITLEKNRAYTGTVQDVLVEGYSKTDTTMLSGRTFGGKLVNFSIVPEASTASAKDLIGSIVPVRITSVKTFSFKGELLR